MIRRLFGTKVSSFLKLQTRCKLLSGFARAASDSGPYIRHVVWFSVRILFTCRASSRRVENMLTEKAVSTSDSCCLFQPKRVAGGKVPGGALTTSVWCVGQRRVRFS